MERPMCLVAHHRGLQPSGSNNCFAQADELLAAAIDRIHLPRSNSAAGAVSTCALLLELLEGARGSIRRLGGIRNPSRNN